MRCVGHERRNFDGQHSGRHSNQILKIHIELIVVLISQVNKCEFRVNCRPGAHDRFFLRVTRELKHHNFRLPGVLSRLRARPREGADS